MYEELFSFEGDFVDLRPTQDSIEYWSDYETLYIEKNRSSNTEHWKELC